MSHRELAYRIRRFQEDLSAYERARDEAARELDKLGAEEPTSGRRAKRFARREERLRKQIAQYDDAIATLRHLLGV
jgi:chromosome segregation ATPase